MTQEEKQLLLKDLCARLPYGVVASVQLDIRYVSQKFTEFQDLQLKGILNKKLVFGNQSYQIERAIPYLRSISTMTDKERKEYNAIIFSSFYKAEDEINFYNKYHFDYRGFIEKGLALEAKEGMYKTE